MRIAILGSVALPVPPPNQGGTEWIAYHQAQELTKRGHEVLLFAPKGSKTDARLIEVGKGNIFSYPFDPKTMESSRTLRLEMVYLTSVLEALESTKNDFDIILNNMRGGESLFLPLARLFHKPVVSVLHLPLFEELASIFRKYNAPLISISTSQGDKFPDLNFVATVYNGVDVNKFTFHNSPGDYLLMIGTIGRHKNQGAAIRVAKKLRMKLVLAGRIRDYDYFEELKPDIDGDWIVWRESLGFEEKIQLYQKAKAFLFPIVWEEPFGLVMLEAMSCGTPVIAFDHGAVPEVIVGGKTGFVVKNEDEMLWAVRKIETIERRNCRLHVEQNFTVEKMVDAYETALSKLLS